jgi:hypothetical protein
MTKRLTLYFIIAQAVDILLTAIAVLDLGCVEGNPVLGAMPLWLAFIIKGIATAFVAYCLMKYVKRLWVHKLIVGIMATVITWNSFVILLEMRAL